MQNIKLKKINKLYSFLYYGNNVLYVLCVCLALFLVGMPFVPNAQYYINKSTGVLQQTKNAEIQNDIIPKVNTLVIPSIGVNTEILEGKDAKTLDKGIWRRPKTSTPDKGSNTVFTGHRFMYTSGPKTFYHFDKLNKNDVIFVYWEGKKYTYSIQDILIVKPTDGWVEAPTDEPVLTLYTCTPLWTSKQRLVIKATPQ